jgi:hypothetical protein
LKPLERQKDSGSTFRHLKQPFSRISSPNSTSPGNRRHPTTASNGRAEAEIKQIKKLVCGSKTDGRVDPDKLAQALMLFRNAPAAAVDHHQPKAYSPDRFATVFRHTTAPSPTNGNESQRSWNAV